MAWNPNSSVEEVGKFTALAALGGSILLWYHLDGVWNIGIACILLVLLALLGMFLSTRTRLEELQERRTQVNSFLKNETIGEFALEEAQRREKKRESIRSGLANDEGLTPFGEWHRDNELGRETIAKLEALGGAFPAREEDVFALEESDQKLIAAHKKKVSADRAFKKLIEAP